MTTTVRWNLFAGVAVLATLSLLVLARATARALADPAREADSVPETGPEPGPGDADGARRVRGPAPIEDMDATTLFVNVALSHGFLGAVLVAAAWYARVPPSALGVVGVPDASAVALGIALGVALSLANEAGAALARRYGVGHDERLRELLAPESRRGWAVLLLVVLPLVAGVEELLFRAALIGALAAGYGLPVWALAAVSSVAFGLGHGLQGPGGVVVTGVLGFALAAAFVLTGSLAVVVVAHYLVNALEFLTHELRV